MPTARQLRLAGLVAVGLLIAVGTCSARKNDLATPGARAAYGPRSASADAGGAQFVDVAEAAGFRHTHHKPVLDHKLDNIMAWVCSVGAAAAAGDFDRDGWLDLYVTDSRKGTPNYLYRNNGDGTFTDVAAAAGVADLNGDNGTSMDCIWADYDNDGWIDLYVVLWGRDVLLRNNSDGTFSDVTAGSFRRRDGTPGTNWANGNAVIAFDYNLDGRLDFYVGNYFAEIDLWHLESTRIMHEDFEQARNGGNNYLYRQETDGTFTEVAESIGLDDPGWTLAVGAADLDNDGWPDLYCADDFGPDQLFINNRDGTFANATESAIGFDTKKGMNVDFGDFNNDGWLDIYVANITTAEYLQEGNMLWHNNGPGPDGSISLIDVSLETGTYNGGWGWGAKFFDYDHDADLDIVAVNGFISAGEGNYWYDLASWTVLGQDAADAANWPAIGDRSFSGYEPIRLWRNDGVYSFTEQSVVAGLDSTRDGRGLISFDYDNDGDLDLFIANQDQPPHLYRNQSPADRHWLMVQLETDPATKVNRDGVGTRVTLVTDGGMQIAERDGGNGYSGQSDPRLHFGLAGEDRVSLVEIRWPDGGLQYLENVAADQVVTVRQDSSRYASQMAIAVAPPKPWVRPTNDPQHTPPPIADAELERLLAEMEERLRSGADEYNLGSVYRNKCTLYDQHDRSIDFFEDLVADRPEDLHARIDLGCAYVDKIPTQGGLAAIVSKGRLARKALDQLDWVIERYPELWIAYYARGMNHLHWPRALRHSDDAAADFEKCLAIQQPQAASAGRRDYYLRTYVGLGDAWAKAKKYDRARRAWRDGLAAFPEAPALTDRLAVKDDKKLLEYVEDARSLEQPIDTDLSFFDQQR